jgi:hypothetical protein
MKTHSRSLTLLGIALATGAAAAAAAASNGGPAVSLVSWHRAGTTEYVTLRLCGASGAQSIRITESAGGDPRRLTFATSTDSVACTARNVYWRAGSAERTRTTISVQVRDAHGALSPVVTRSQVV